MWPQELHPLQHPWQALRREVEQAKRSSEHQKTQIMRLLEAHACTKSGKGAFAEVWRRDEWTLKLVETRESARALAYLRAAQRHRASPDLFPQVVHMSSVGRFSLVIMETLQHRPTWAETILASVDWAMAQAARFPFPDERPRLSLGYPQASIDRTFGVIHRLLVRPDPRKWLPFQAFRMDLRPENVMFRPGADLDQPVLVDPLAY